MSRCFAATGLLLATLAVAGCAPLTLYNSLVPSDVGVEVARSDIAYGPLPRQRLDVYVPAARKSPVPVVVIFYGGSWNSGSKEQYAFLGKAIASRGFVAIVADYRLVPEVRFPAFLEDGALAIVWAHRKAKDFGGDPDKLYLLGHSAGAYNAVMIALDGRYLTAAGASPTLIRGVAALAGPYDFKLDVASTRAAFGRAPDYAATQPVNFVTREAPALFLATGNDDTTVQPRNTEALAEKMRRAGRPVTVRRYAGIGHVGILLALSKPLRAQAPVLDDVARFFADEQK